MPAQPIYLDVEEEISELIERLRRTPSQEVPVVVPARSRIGQSRFNFRLLRDYAREFQKRIAIISNDRAIQQMAQENGFNAFADMLDYGSPEAEPELAMAGVAAGSAPPFTPSQRPSPRPDAPAPQRPSKLSLKPAGSYISESVRNRSWFVLYLGAGIIAMVAMLSAVVLVPSASVTLRAQAQVLSDTATIDAAPNSAPVKVRQVLSKHDLSQQFHATGVKVTPAVQAAGAVLYTNNCGVGIKESAGQVLSTPSGVDFVQQATVTVEPGTASANVLAAAAGAAGNVPPNSITIIKNENGGLATCFKVNNTQATAGGADEVKTPIVSQGDLDSAKAQLEGQLRGTILDDLTKQAGASEKLADTVDYQDTFTADHKANDAVQTFQGAVSMTGSGAVYNTDDVKKALAADLGKKVPSGFELTDNPVQSDFHISQSTADGHISFAGTAKGYIAPKIDFQKVRSRLLGSSTASARLYLGTLPVESAVVNQKPFKLPLLPFLSSRIDIKYIVDTGVTPTPAQ